MSNMLLLTLALAATSSLLFITISPPRIPLYKIRSLHFSTLSISSLWTNLTLSTTFLAGVQIENENFVGADIYATIIDLYYPDWSGELQHIGVLRETKTMKAKATTNNLDFGTTKNEGRGEIYPCRNISLEKNENMENRSDNNEDVCVSHPKQSTPQSPSPPNTPFFTIEANGISISDANAVSIILTNIAPKTYLNILKDALMAWGVIEVRVSGGAHVKSSLGSIPLTLGLSCNNDLDLFRYPVSIAGKDCIVKGIRTGWVGLDEFAFKLRGKTMQQYDNKGAL